MDLLLDDLHLDTAVSLKKNIQNQIKRNIEANTPNGHYNHMRPLWKRVMSQDRYCVGVDENRGQWMNMC